MRVEIIGVGSELLTDNVNTNAVYIGKKLLDIGLSTSFHTNVGDNLSDMKNAISDAYDRSDIIIITGGLGPTFDDITREALSSFLGEKLIFDEKIFLDIQQHYKTNNRVISESIKKMAYRFEDCEMLENKTGAALGIIKHLKDKNKIFILLPGPPFEMQPMLDDVVLAYLRKNTNCKIIKTCVLRTSGLPESRAEAMLKPLMDNETLLEKGNVSFTILAKPMMVDFKITVVEDDELIAENLLHKIKQECINILGDNIYGEDDDTLAKSIGKKLFLQSKTLSVAESCTGGLISNTITDVPGSSHYFREGLVVYSNESKIELLNIDENLLKHRGAVSREVALALAKNIREITDTSFGVSVTGIAGPTGGSVAKPVGLVYVAISSKFETEVWECRFRGDRDTIKLKTLNFCLDKLRRELFKYEDK